MSSKHRRLCEEAVALPPSPLMVSKGNNYYTCSTCGKPCDAPVADGVKKNGTDFKFINRAPTDKEWSAHIHLLNEWTPTYSQLRHIMQYARSGPFYPADMHVDLIKQWCDNTRVEIAMTGLVPAIEKDDTKSAQNPVDN